MLDLTILFLLLNALLIIWLIFVNGFQARKNATALLPPAILLWLVYLFDAYINKSRIKLWFVELIMNLKIIPIETTDQVGYATFIAGLLIIVETVAFYFMLYAIYANLFSYVPPILRSKKEKQVIFWNAFLWKSVLFIGCNMFLIFALIISNKLMELPLGFLAPIFKLGVGL